ncbi:GNAT family N-acetyltransferase [Enterococcus sp. HY326]|uniref:GNAT family N-acetyltransferase n=1 Tax=Enterococcus sp. HY326 TaxID=2971265 RepID=UPI0022408A57|nr:GNAT family N-acetyltransferase [Enterococcus sp. HY326]
MRLVPLTSEKFPELLEFEEENRNFFRQHIPDRGDDYFLPEEFQGRNEALLMEQANQQSFFYLIVNEAGQVIGRINLTDCNWQQQSAELGYRIGEGSLGKGMATQAVDLISIEAQTLGLKKILAYTTNNNLASQKVLTKSGFQFTHQASEPFLFLDEEVFFVYFEKMI